MGGSHVMYCCKSVGLEMCKTVWCNVHTFKKCSVVRVVKMIRNMALFVSSFFFYLLYNPDLKECIVKHKRISNCNANYI